MVDLRASHGERPVQGRDRQLLLQAAAQVPAPDTAGEQVHQHRQIYELLLQPDVGDVGHPDLIRTNDLQALDEVRVARERVVAVGGPGPPCGRRAAEAHLVHQPPHALDVDPVARAVEHNRQAAVAVGRPLPGQLPQGVSEWPVLGRPRLMVKGAAMHVEGLAEEPD
jgi:hypothetical protein